MTEKPRQASEQQNPAARTDPARLHPSDLFRATPGAEPTGGEFEIVRSPRTRVRGMLGWALLAVVLCAVPPVIVWWRNEPSYLVSAAWVVALIAAIVAVVVLLAIAWFAPLGRSGQVLSLDDDAITVGPASGHEPGTIAWADVRRCQIAGRFLPSLVIAATDSPPAAEETESEADETPDDAPGEQAAPPIDFENDPPPPFTMPSADVFEQIRPIDEASDTDASDAEASEQAADEQAADDDAPQTRRLRGAEWNKRFYGTPYVISLWGSSPDRAALAAALAAYSERRFGASGTARK